MPEQSPDLRGANETARLGIAFDTSTRSTAVGLWSAASGVAERALDSDRAQAADLTPAIAELLAAANARPTELDWIAVGLGPGSYTGLRVGLATALGMTRSTGAHLIGIPSFDVRALAALESNDAVCIVDDARSGWFNVGCYAKRDGTLESVSPLASLAIDDARERVRDFARAHERAQVECNRALLAQFDLDALADEKHREPAAPTARALCHLAVERANLAEWTALDALRPIYLRDFGERAPAN